MMPEAILIAGPTASGKSAAAIAVAKAIDGCIINADSMQVYEVLRIITARPDEDELKSAPHLLYGFVPPSVQYSVARWLDDVTVALHQLRVEGRIPVFVGGTGLYLKALLEGLSPVPPVEPKLRVRLRKESEADPAALYLRLQQLDPQSAAKLEPGDSQRIVRALEVVESTGKSLLQWQREEQGESLLEPARCIKYILSPDREELRDRISKRFELMLENGALNEVRHLNALDLPPTFPAMRAIGIPELLRHLHGELSIDRARELATIASHQYAKRQRTWMKNQFGTNWKWFSSSSDLVDDFNSQDFINH